MFTQSSVEVIRYTSVAENNGTTEKAAVGGWRIRRPLRSLKETESTACKGDNGQRTFAIWCKKRLSNAEN